MRNTKRGFPPLVGHVSVCGSWVFLQILVVLGKPRRGCCLWRPGNVRGGVVPDPANEGGRSAAHGLRLGFCCVVVSDELQAEFIYEHVEGAKAVACTRVGSVGIHDYVGIVGGPDKELHEEPARPAVVVSGLV